MGSAPRRYCRAMNRLLITRWLGGILLCGAVSGAQAQPALERIDASKPIELLAAPRDDEARLAPLAAHPTWRRLLHWDDTQGQSEVTSPGFFLATNGRHDALAELHATLEAGRSDLSATPLPPNHPRCRWPARYLWLMRQGLLPMSPAVPTQCHNLRNWVHWDELVGVSVLLVSGYLGNPASTFGHALLRLDTHRGQAHAGRLDVSVNFGAVVPEHESLPSYIAKGIAGGYTAHFSDKPFYADDLVYAHTEFRDMWNYRLALNEDQRTLLVLHLWEMLGQSFDYYFLNRNCALRLAELIELATDRPVVGGHTFWYAPVELFQALHSADSQGPALLDGPPQFRPSAERVLAQRFAELNPTAQALARGLAQDDLAELEPRLATSPLEEQQAVLEALLAWYEQRLAALQRPGAHEASVRALKDRLLWARLQRPIRPQTDSAPMAEHPSPALGHAPALLALGWHRDPTGTSQIEGEATVFSYELGGVHGLERGALVTLATRWQSRSEAHGRRRGELAALDVLRILKLSDPVDPAGHMVASWRMRLGASREVWPGTDPTRPSPLRTQAEGAMGLALPRPSWGDAWLLFGTRWREAQALAWGPELGWQIHAGVWGRWVGEHAWERTLSGAHQARHRLSWVLPTARDQAWRLQWQSDAAHQQIDLWWQHFF